MSYIRRKIKKLFKRSVKKKDLVRLREGILEYYDKNGLPDDDPDLKSAVAYIRDKGTKAFPYTFGDKYDDMQVEVFKDPECGLRYVLHGGRRLYFVKGWGDRRVLHTYAALLREQDPDSPHCYQQADLGVEEGDTLFDIGCAEALLTLMVVDKVKAAYLFEGDPRWIEPLRRTFEPWKEKVTIVDKFVSDKDTPTSVTIGRIIERDAVAGRLFLKLDVEGAEKEVIAGMSEAIGSYPDAIDAVVCTYHNQNDFAELSSLMRSEGFDVSPSKGYMLFIYDYKRLKPPYFRKGAIYCRKR